MTQVRRGYVDGPFGQIHLRIAAPEAASLRPLLCLHQSPKSGLEMEAVAAACGVERVTVAADYPGYGLSDPPPTESDATIEAYAEAMWAVADALDLGSVDLFGNHTGGMVAVEMTRVRPQAVGAITMVSCAILTDDERAAFETFFSPIPLDPEGARFTTMWARIRQSAGPGVSLEWMARSFMQNLLGGDRYEWGHAAAFAYAPRLADILSTLTTRIVVINPADELQEATRRAVPLLRNGVILEKPEWGHGFLDFHANDVARLVREAWLGNGRSSRPLPLEIKTDCEPLTPPPRAGLEGDASAADENPCS